MSEVILVNEEDKDIGKEEKLKAHIEGKLHRAFSIFIFNSKGELLIQQRAKTKYHSGDLWSNTCCSHPNPEESLEETTKNRLKEELGIKSDLKEIFSFQYKVKLNDLIENEIDHVFIGTSDEVPKPNPEEVESFKWISLDDLKKDISISPEKYTYWLKIILQKYFNKLKEEIK